MACQKRIKTGHCGHHQCEFSDYSGYECVEIVGNYCECGCGCTSDCSYSWPYHDENTNEQALKAFEEIYGE